MTSGIKGSVNEIANTPQVCREFILMMPVISAGGRWSHCMMGLPLFGSIMAIVTSTLEIELKKGLMKSTFIDATCRRVY